MVGYIVIMKLFIFPAFLPFFDSCDYPFWSTAATVEALGNCSSCDAKNVNITNKLLGETSVLFINKYRLFITGFSKHKIHVRR